MRKLLFALVATIFSFSATAGGHAEWWKNAGAPYAGTTLQGIAENTPPGQFAGDVLAKEFEELTGIKVRLENTSWIRCMTKLSKIWKLTQVSMTSFILSKISFMIT
jgi:multiple sugar transport system substrate-binding protein